LAVELGAQAEDGFTPFELYFIDLMHHVSIQQVEEEEAPGGVKMTLNPAYSGDSVLRAYEGEWGVKQWTPLMLGRALADYKERIGGGARVVAVGPDFIELAQTRCEFGEPREGRFSGNLCAVCRSATLAVARSSSLGRECAAVGRCTIAQGCRVCDLTISFE